MWPLSLQVTEYWVISLNMLFLAPPVCLRLFNSCFLQLNKMALNTYVFIHWWVKESGVHVLVVVNAAVDEPGWMSVSLVGNSLYWVYTQSGIAGSYGRSVFEKLPLFPPHLFAPWPTVNKRTLLKEILIVLSPWLWMMEKFKSIY